MEKQIEAEMAEMLEIIEKSREEWSNDVTDHTENEYIREGLLNARYRKQREGHWFITEYEYFTCSECGHDHYNGCDSTKEAKERLADGEYPNFCSNCGAKMKGGVQE